MTIETYPEMDVKIIELLRWDTGNPLMLYAAQRIEELEQIASVRGKCLKIAMEALKHYATFPINLLAQCTLDEIKARLAELEPEESTQR